jgi:3-dehydroquinate synthase
LQEAVSELNPDKVFYLFEENTNRLCKPLIKDLEGLSYPDILVLEPGEENKSIDQLMKVWDYFEENGAGRNSCLITIGGGMLTDLGGFAACTFKRGMSFINVPTTLLAMVDASVGGKTGFNYHGLKNEIGVIRQPNNVLIHAPFLFTLDQENFLSGYAEMLKTALIMDEDLWSDLINYDLNTRNLDCLIPLIWRSVGIKNSIVEIDPEEANERRSLNFGHTIAHSLESLSLKKMNHLHHGYAVAYGMIIESILSEEYAGLDEKQANYIRKFLNSIYGDIPFTSADIPQLLEFMLSDKKNDNSLINFTLLDKTGGYKINNYLSSDEVKRVLNQIYS